MKDDLSWWVGGREETKIFIPFICAQIAEKKERLVRFSGYDFLVISVFQNNFQNIDEFG